MRKSTQGFDPRQIMNRKEYEIFHYLDIKTRHLDAHYHDFYEIYLFLDGDMDYWVEGNLYHLERGDILLISPSQLHKPIPLSDSENYERIVLWIDKGYLSEIEGGIFEGCFNYDGGSTSKILRPKTQEKSTVVSLCENLVGEFYGQDFAGDICARSILVQLLTQINRIALASENKYSENLLTSTFISDIISFIGEHYNEEITLDTIANQFFISKYYLSHEFKKTVGTGVHKYITLKRLSIAYNLLTEGNPAGEVCQACGFKDYTTFFRAFKAEYGISPAECHAIN